MYSTYYHYCRRVQHYSRSCVFRFSEYLVRVEFRTDLNQTAARLAVILLLQNRTYVTFIWCGSIFRKLVLQADKETSVMLHPLL